MAEIKLLKRDQTAMNTEKLGIVTPRTIVSFCLLLVLLVPAIRDYSDVNRQYHSFYLFCVGFFVSTLLIPIVYHIGIGLNIVDHPDQKRKYHAAPTPLTGGIAIFCGFLATLVHNFHFSREMKAIFLSSTLIFIIGLLDDRFGLSSKIRLLVQCVAGLIVVYFGVHVSFIPHWFGGSYTEAVITLVWILGITNSMNFIDGMDGIASGSSMIYAFFFWLIAFITGQAYLEYLALALVGCCLGFFQYNFRYNKNAHIFLGDSGSTFLGFLLACLGIVGKWGESIVDITVPILIMSVLIFDMVLTTFLRIYRKDVRSFSEWVDFTGRDHFHYQLNFLGLPKGPAVLLYLTVNLCFGLIALVVLFSGVFTAVLSLLHTIIAFAIIGVILVFGNTDAYSAGKKNSAKQRHTSGKHYKGIEKSKGVMRSQYDCQD